MTKRSVIAVGIAGLALAIPAAASADIVMDFPELATLKETHIPVAAYAFQRSAPPLARMCTGAGGSGTFTVTKPVDASSPELAEAAKTKSATQVLVDDQKPNGKRVAFQFIGATVTAVTPIPKGDQPMETVAFSYSKIQWVTVGCALPPRVIDRDAFGSGHPPSYGDMGGGGMMGGGGYR